jgi:hypothetical protein
MTPTFSEAIHMRATILFLSAALFAASAIATAATPSPVASGTVVAAPGAVPPATNQVCAPAAGGLDRTATAPAMAEPGVLSLRSPAGMPQPSWLLGGNCLGQFTSCRNACGGNTLCDQGCECVYCVCAGLLCPNYCGSGQD